MCVRDGFTHPKRSVCINFPVSWQINLLVATKVGEEGLDIQTCCLVVRFDLPETVASFIQSRGRARMPQSEYAFLVDRYYLKHLYITPQFIPAHPKNYNKCALLYVIVAMRRSKILSTVFLKLRIK